MESSTSYPQTSQSPTFLPSDALTSLTLATLWSCPGRGLELHGNSAGLARTVLEQGGKGLGVGGLSDSLKPAGLSGLLENTIEASVHPSATGPVASTAFGTH